MKKLIFLFSFLFFASSRAHALDPAVWTSTNTQVVGTLVNLCLGQSYLVNGSTVAFGNKAIFHAACVNTGAAGSLSIFNSSGTATSPVAVINTAAVVPCALYDVIMSSGLTFTNSATANITLTYQCY